MALLHTQFRSEILEMHVPMDVILPESTPPPGGFPTLYLLHGLSDDHSAWQRWTSIERYVRDLGLAVVMPTVHRGFYTDMKHGPKYFTFVSEELPAVCECLFKLRTDRAGRFAAGLSMGGYGALKLGLRCPDRYQAVATLSGAIDMMARRTQLENLKPESFYLDIFGTMEEAAGSENDLVAVAEQLLESGVDCPAIYMACGTEDFLYRNNQDFLKAFENRLPITYEEGPGAHTWDFWDVYIQKVLGWLPR